MVAAGICFDRCEFSDPIDARRETIRSETKNYFVIFGNFSGENRAYYSREKAAGASNAPARVIFVETLLI